LPATCLTEACGYRPSAVLRETAVAARPGLHEVGEILWHGGWREAEAFQPPGRTPKPVRSRTASGPHLAIAACNGGHRYGWSAARSTSCAAGRWARFLAISRASEQVAVKGTRIRVNRHVPALPTALVSFAGPRHADHVRAREQAVRPERARGVPRRRGATRLVVLIRAGDCYHSSADGTASNRRRLLSTSGTW
jgi:hypothetical protein